MKTYVTKRREEIAKDKKIEKRIKSELHKIKILKNSYNWIATGSKDNKSDESDDVKLEKNVPVVSTDEPENLDVFVVTDYGVSSVQEELLLSPVSSGSENLISNEVKFDFFKSATVDERKCTFINNVLSDQNLTDVQKGILLESDTYNNLDHKNYKNKEITLIKAILNKTFSSEEAFAIKQDDLKLYYLKVGKYENTASMSITESDDKFETMYNSFSIVQKYKELYKKIYHANKRKGNPNKKIVIPRKKMIKHPNKRMLDMFIIQLL